MSAPHFGSVANGLSFLDFFAPCLCLQGKLCCVIGSSGCLGRELVSELLRRGYNVHGFDLKDPVVDDERVTYFKGSLTSSEVSISWAAKAVTMRMHTRC